MELEGGIDEAGRGPVIGSMFIGGVAATDEQVKRLNDIGLKDSKKLSHSKRKKLGHKINEIAEKTTVTEVEASEIDRLREVMSLNAIEVRAFANVTASLGAETCYLDLPEPDGNRFSNKIIGQLPKETDIPEIIAEHKADEKYLLVSAASIIAKNKRESHISLLHDKYETNFGSGYPHDTPTIEFLQTFLNEHNHLPDDVRKSWSTAKRLQAEAGQSSIDRF